MTSSDRCHACVAGLACVTKAADLIYRCNECHQIIVQLDIYGMHRMYVKTRSTLPGEIRLDGVFKYTGMAREHCPGYPSPRMVQNDFMLCQKCTKGE